MIFRQTPQNKVSVLPKNSAERKKYCIFSGVMSPFPDALAIVAKHSYDGNMKHCPDDEPMQWDMSKSSDHLDCMGRHTLEEDWGAVAWRALANLQTQYNNGWRPDNGEDKAEPQAWGPTKASRKLLRMCASERANITELETEENWAAFSEKLILQARSEGFFVTKTLNPITEEDLL